MKITLNHITNLLKLFEKGLINGAGQDVNHFCVQQAVHRVLDDKLDDPTKSDKPPTWCVSEGVRHFGVLLNDADGWSSNANRAKGLQRFAIAELGSADTSTAAFHRNLKIKLSEVLKTDATRWEPSNIINEFACRKGGMSSNDRLTYLANAAADVLRDLGTEGAQFLYLIDEPDRKKRKEQARKLGHKIYAAQLADAASKCAWGVPQQMKHH